MVSALFPAIFENPYILALFIYLAAVAFSPLFMLLTFQRYKSHHPPFYISAIIITASLVPPMGLILYLGALYAFKKADDEAEEREKANDKKK